MKKLTVLAAMVALVAVLASCKGKHDYKSFIGTWGVKHLEYYNIDYAGNPINATMETYDFVPGDMNSGIDLVFREDKTGEMRDRSRDTLKLDWDDSLHVYQTIIICPDTVIVTKFTYSYDDDEDLLFMNIQEAKYIYQMLVKFIDDDSFVYKNEYKPHYMEEATMVRYTSSTRGAKSATLMKRHPESLLSNY